MIMNCLSPPHGTEDGLGIDKKAVNFGDEDCGEAGRTSGYTTLSETRRFSLLVSPNPPHCSCVSFS